MRTLFIIVSYIVLLSCTTFESEQRASPYQNYQSYLNALKASNYDAATNMLSLNNRTKFINNRDGESFNDFFPFFSSIGTVITNEKNHYQVVDGQKACLTINGFNDVYEPTSLYFELLNEDNKWKFSYVQMNYHASINEFSSAVKCPFKPQG